MSPRRSVRARQTQPLTASHEPSNSASSTSSGRVERGIRSTLRQESYNKSQTPQLSSDESEAMDAPEQQARQTRQKKRAQDVHDDVELAPVGAEPLDEDIDADAEEEEVTRCVCRKQEYPGPPIPLEEGNRSHKAKDQQNGISIAALDGLPEDAGSLFIQCDDCKVWQHGGCVGIMEEAMSPENYYCEECRKDLHKLMTGARGQRYSRYLPVYEILHPPPKSARKSPPSKESESRSSRDPDVKAAAAAAAAAASLSSAKRRSTMNSRAAMEEEEALRKAIEESKSDGSVVNFGNGSRSRKRNRDDSEETKQDLKRRKTGSDPDSPPDVDGGILGAESDEEESGTRSKSHHGSRKVRGAAAQVQKEKEIREREKEKERERLEAAGRRKGRAERRRVDESEPPEETPRIGATPRTSTTAKSSRSQIAKLPISTLVAATPSVSHKKQPRNAARRGRVGRNQYTKDRDTALDSKIDTPQPTNSRDSDEICNGNNDVSGVHIFSNGSKPSKPRQMNAKTSMVDLRKRAAGILEYVSRTQVELAGERTPPNGGNNASNAVLNVSNGSSATALPLARPPLARNISVNGASKLSRQLDGGDDRVEPEKGTISVDEASFRQMSNLQMMDVLMRQIAHWQKDHGKPGDK